MKISLVAVGTFQDADYKSIAQDYIKRISNYINFDIIETTDDKLAKVLEKYDRIFLLDDKGKEYTSKEFSDFLQKQMNQSAKQIAFVIGGAYGFSEEVRSKAQGLISLSKLTFPHQLVRPVFLEQLYRAFTIINNEKYHHE